MRSFRDPLARVLSDQTYAIPFIFPRFEILLRGRDGRELFSDVLVSYQVYERLRIKDDDIVRTINSDTSLVLIVRVHGDTGFLDCQNGTLRKDRIVIVKGRCSQSDGNQRIAE